MDRKNNIRNLIENIASEVLDFIKEEEAKIEDRWVPAALIKENLGLNLVAVPQANKQHGPKGWLFAIARMLEERNVLEYRKLNGRAYYRTKRSL